MGMFRSNQYHWLGFSLCIIFFLFQRYPIVCNLFKMWLVVMDLCIGFGGGKNGESSELCVLTNAQKNVQKCDHVTL